jgi:hypothetical protein
VAGTQAGRCTDRHHADPSGCYGEPLDPAELEGVRAALAEAGLASSTPLPAGHVPPGASGTAEVGPTLGRATVMDCCPPLAPGRYQGTG